MKDQLDQPEERGYLPDRRGERIDERDAIELSPIRPGWVSYY